MHGRCRAQLSDRVGCQIGLVAANHQSGGRAWPTRVQWLYPKGSRENTLVESWMKPQRDFSAPGHVARASGWRDVPAIALRKMS